MVKVAIFVLISLFISNSWTCVEYIYDIHTFISNMGDVFSNMEANMRIQYNTIQLDRIKTLTTLLNALENIQNSLPKDLCKYQGTEESISFLQIGQELVANVRKNLIYSARAEFEEMRIDQSNFMFGYIAAMAEFLEDCFEPAKAYFTDGKACVISLEKNIQSFLETGSTRVIQCMKNNTVTNPLTPPRFKKHIDFMTTAYTKLATDMKKPFIFPVLIGYWSTKKQNETAAASLLTVMQDQFQSNLDITKTMAQAGLDLVESIEKYNEAVKKCNKLVNVTYIAPKRDEILGNIRYCGGV